MMPFSLDSDLPPEVDKYPLSPIKIKAYLDRFVVGQDSAKMTLSVAAYNHYKRCSLIGTEHKVTKNNVLLIGPTGTGKTFLLEKLAEYLEMPFTIGDASRLTSSGYHGDNVDELLAPLLSATNGNVELAETGIVYIDEIDKIYSKTSDLDVTGSGVQRELLKMIEGSLVKVKTGEYPMRVTHNLNTKNILFILGGAFDGIHEILDSGSTSKTMGFNGNICAPEPDLDLLRSKISHKDVIKYGFLPELVGRIATIATLNALRLEDLIRILAEVDNCLLSEYDLMFYLDDIRFDVTDEAITLISQHALKCGMGARALKGLIEKCLIDIMFSYPQSSNKHAILDEELVISKLGKI